MRQNRVLVIGIVGSALLLTAIAVAAGPAHAQTDGQKGQHTVEFLTVRNFTGAGDPQVRFGDDRGDKMRAGMCHLSDKPFRALESIAQRAPFYVPDGALRLDDITGKSIAQVWDDVAAAAHGRPPLLYVNGAYTNFAKGCRQASIFQEAHGLDGRLVLFSWPADAALLNYTRDESDLYWSVLPLEDAIAELTARFGAGGFDIAAHSLGTRGTFIALTNLYRDNPATKPLVNRLILFAPDIDPGIFRQHLPRIRAMARRITIYVSSNDRALALASGVHGVARLGQPGAHLGDLDGIEIIDISDASVRYPFGHGYHLFHRDVVRDVNQLLVERQPAAERGNLTQTGPNYWRLTGS